VPGTTLARDPDNLGNYLLVTEVVDPTNPEDNVHTLLEWIGADNDGFSAATPPGWSGFCDVTPSNQTAIKTPGSDLTLASTIISNLSKNSAGTSEVSLSGPQYPAIFFRDQNRRYVHTPEKLYDVKSCMGVVSGDNTCISTVESSANEILTFQTPGSGVANKLISEQYKLAWTAYAIRPVARGDGNYNLVLYYNYQPWHGENLNSGWPGTHATLVTNVTVFKFAESGNTFRFKLCAQENIGEDFNITICKEKAIIL
jgi:hypothetical protein